MIYTTRENTRSTNDRTRLLCLVCFLPESARGPRHLVTRPGRFRFPHAWIRASLSRCPYRIALERALLLKKYTSPNELLAHATERLGVMPRCRLGPRPTANVHSDERSARAHAARCGITLPVVCAPRHSALPAARSPERLLQFVPCDVITLSRVA